MNFIYLWTLGYINTNMFYLFKSECMLANFLERKQNKKKKTVTLYWKICPIETSWHFETKIIPEQLWNVQHYFSHQPHRSFPQQSNVYPIRDGSAATTVGKVTLSSSTSYMSLSFGCHAFSTDSYICSRIFWRLILFHNYKNNL